MNVGSCGVWEGEKWVWVLNWRREMFEWEKEQLGNLLAALQLVNLVKDEGDDWVWEPESAYQLKGRNVQGSCKGTGLCSV